jgi:hypothetical protein
MPPKKLTNQQINVHLSGHMIAFLERLAAENGITRAAQIRMFLLDTKRRMEGDKPPPRLEGARPPR